MLQKNDDFLGLIWVVARSALYVRDDKTRMSQICSSPPPLLLLQIIITFYRAASEGGDSAVVYW